MRQPPLLTSPTASPESSGNGSKERPERLGVVFSQAHETVQLIKNSFFLLPQDLIEMIVNLQDAVEHHAKKQSDLEDYIDALLTKVIANAPDLLQKNAQMEAKYRHRL